MTFLVETKSKGALLGDLRSALVISLTAAFFLIFGITNPSYNWDIVAYVSYARKLVIRGNLHLLTEFEFCQQSLQIYYGVVS